MSLLHVHNFRIFSHPNVLPVIGAVNDHKDLIVLSQHMQYGSLFNILHEGTGIIVDQEQGIKFAMDIARGMEYLHSLDQLIPRLYLKSTHIMVRTHVFLTTTWFSSSSD